MLAAPVRVKVPIITPTTEQAIPTGKAALAPSARASLQFNRVTLPPALNKFHKINIARIIATAWLPN